MTARADLAVTGSRVWIGDGSWSHGLAVRAGRIVAHGAEVAELIGPRTEVLHGLGAMVVPGFQDSHIHAPQAGRNLTHVDLRDLASRDAYLERLGAYLGEHPDIEWIVGGGWSMEHFPGGAPHKEDLDAVTGARPAFLFNRDVHGAWVNSAALRLGGIDAGTPDPSDGRYERDANGEPTGMLHEGAAYSYEAHFVPSPTREQWEQAILVAQRHLHSLGITGWQDAIVGSRPGLPDPVDAYLRGSAAGTLLVNVVGAMWWERNGGIEQVAEMIERRREARADRFRATSVKMMLDGVAENHTAAMLEPYLDGHGCATEVSGLDFIDPAELPRFVTALDAEGFQVHFHSLGDRAVRNALDAIQAARTANGVSGQRHHLAHIQVVHPDDVPRFAALEATANMQPLWATHEPQMDELTIPFLGERRTTWQYPFGSLHAAGAALAGGSDWSVSSPDPLLGAHVAVNRALPAEPGSSAAEPFLPEQAIAREVILGAYTSGSARVNGLADVTGAIRPGLDADFAIADADLAHCAAMDIGRATVTSTWVRGQAAYQRT